MKSIVDSGELGKILWMRGATAKKWMSHFSKHGGRPKTCRWRYLAGSGNSHVGSISALRRGLDEVSAFISNHFWKIDGIEDNVFAIYRSSETGISASLHSTMTQWRYLFSLEVFLEGGALILNGLKTSSGAYGDEILSIKRNPSHLMDGRFEEEETLTYKVDSSWESEVLHFFNAIEKKGKIIFGSSQDASCLMNLIDQTYDRKC